MAVFTLEKISDLEGAVRSGETIDLSRFKNANWEQLILDAATLIQNYDYHDHGWKDQFCIGQEIAFSTGVCDGLIKFLCIHINGHVNLSFLEAFQHLETLYISWRVKFEGLSPIACISPVRSIYLSANSKLDNEPLDLTALYDLKGIRELTVSCIPILDFGAIATMTNLIDLEIQKSNIEDLRPIQHLTKLESLGLYVNNIKDITPLRFLMEKGIPVIHSNHPVLSESEKYIAIAGNPIESPPLKVILMGNWAILDYWDGRRDFPGQYNTCEVSGEILEGDVPFEIILAGKDAVAHFLWNCKRRGILV